MALSDSKDKEMKDRAVYMTGEKSRMPSGSQNVEKTEPRNFLIECGILVNYTLSRPSFKEINIKAHSFARWILKISKVIGKTIVQIPSSPTG